MELKNMKQKETKRVEVYYDTTNLKRNHYHEGHLILVDLD
jgi:hypothetical protein